MPAARRSLRSTVRDDTTLLRRRPRRARGPLDSAIPDVATAPFRMTAVNRPHLTGRGRTDSWRFSLLRPRLIRLVSLAPVRVGHFLPEHAQVLRPLDAQPRH